MADFLTNVDSDNGPEEPTPVTIVSAGGEVSLLRDGGATIERGSPSFATAQVQVQTTATPVAPARPDRNRIQIIITGATRTAVGADASVSLNTGFPLPAAANTTMTLYTTGPIYMIGSAAVNVGIVEYYG